jgi:hypothetical protein
MSSAEAVKRQLALHRMSPPVGLNQDHPITYQMDKEFCEAISSQLKDCGGQWEIRKATPTLWKQIPEKCGVYLFLFESSLTLQTASGPNFHPRLVLYVGRAGDQASRKTLRDRYKAEYSKYVGGDPAQLWGEDRAATRSERLSRYLAIYPLQYWFCTIEDHSKIADAERSLIKLLNPPLNVAGRAKVRVLPPAPAFRSP